MVYHKTVKLLQQQTSSCTGGPDSLLEDVLENVLEAAIIGFEDCVLGAHVERPLLLDGVLEAAVSKAIDGLEMGRERQINISL